MALPVVLKSGKNYISLVLDKEMEFSELLSHIINKFVENSSFFEGQSFAIMLEGRELSDREKNIILDAIQDYTSINVTQLIENDVYRQYVVEKEAFDRLHPVTSEDEDDSKLHTMVENNCLFLEKDVVTGERIYANNNVIIKGNVESGAIVKAGNSIIIIGTLEGQALAGVNDDIEDAYIFAREFYPENFRIGTFIGSPQKKPSSGIFKKRTSPKLVKVIDGELQIKTYKN